MGELAIRVQGLGKRYLIGAHLHQATLMERLNRRIKHPFGKAEDPNIAALHGGMREFWALKDVSFAIRTGEVIGVVGRNGAGKSTLLKILSRITRPTEGFAEVRGRVGSLLQVGTGFHPELTGRENVLLSGAILGMSQGEIRRKFDEIIAFADIAEFIDTPIKYYSSGMNIRLGFSLAAHVDCDIVFLDEVFGVGDQNFLKKSRAKMMEMIGSGRTVLIVSHNMPTIESLCSRCLLLDHGRLLLDGTVQEVVGEYEYRFG